MLIYGPEHCEDGVSIAFYVSFNDLARDLGKDKARAVLAQGAGPYAAAKRMLQQRMMMDAGVVPPWFDEASQCVNCGDVMVPTGSGPVLDECPWCDRYNVPRETHEEFVERHRRALEEYRNTSRNHQPSIALCTEGGWFHIGRS
jgi:hypothetical protein